MDRLAELKFPTEELAKLISDSQIQVFKRSDLERLLSDNRLRWEFSDHITTSRFISHLLSSDVLNEVKFQFPGRTEIRYTSGEVSDFALVLALRPNSYLSHHTAMHLNNLIESAPETIYVNSEQSAKKNGQGVLEQSAIDRAFNNKARETKMRTTFKDKTVCLLNGKFTDQLGVENYTDSLGRRLRVTSIERTLIDITVRPVYAGGVAQVLWAFGKARPRVSVETLLRTLRQLDFVYPYHQAIGFYMQSTGLYNDSELGLLKANRMEYDFYLDNHMTERQYSPEWRLYYPRGIERQQTPKPTLR